VVGLLPVDPSAAGPEETLRSSGLPAGGFPREYFRRALARARLSQAYLFVGPEGSGRKRFARELAKAVFCSRGAPCGGCASCHSVDHGNHPGVHLYSVPEGKGSIDIEAVRDLAHRVHLRREDYLVAVIEEADRMGGPAANALLKTLEEPTGVAVIILIARSSGVLLPTIVSRAHRIPFMAAAAPEEAPAVPAEAREPVQSALEEISKPGFFAGKDLREWLSGLLPGMQTNREAVRRLLDLMIAAEREGWTDGGPGRPALLDFERKADRLEELMALRDDLDRNVHPDLVLEALFELLGGHSRS
jgi:hypothetical protein